MKTSKAVVLAASALCLAIPAWADIPAPKRTPIIQVRQGAMPNDTSSDAVKLSQENRPELGGTALKVVLPAGESFGQGHLANPDWSGFTALQFDASNPATANLPLTLTIKEKNSTSLANRVDVPVLLKPGKNSISIDLTGLANGDGSRPDLTSIRQWYLATLDTPATAYFGDFFLVSAALPAASTNSAPAPAASSPAPGGSGQSVRIVGKIGDIPIDLTITGVSVAASGSGATASASTPGASGPDPAATDTAPKSGRALIAVSKGEMPNDRTPDDLNLDSEDRVELGGTALKVSIPVGGSFGQSHIRLADWSGYGTFRFQAFNPNPNDVPLSLTIKHRGSTNFGTRVNYPLVLKPGKNTVSIDLTGLTNTNGSKPDLGAVSQWYLSSDNGAPSLYFGDFTLETAKQPG